MKKSVFLLLSAALLFTSMGCGWSNKAQGGEIGAGTEGAASVVIGRAAGNSAQAAIIAAAVGGTAGTIIGNQNEVSTVCAS